GPIIILLFTEGDSPTQWLRAGMGLQRILLTATANGLAATPLTQLTEIPRLRRLLADTAAGRIVQTVLRVGYPLMQGPRTPRRPLEEVLLSDAIGSGSSWVNRSPP